MKNKTQIVFCLWLCLGMSLPVRAQDSWIYVDYPSRGLILDWACENVMWKSSSDIQYVVIDYSLDYGKTWQRVPKWGSPSGPSWNDGVSYWNPPWVWTKHALVRVSDANRPGVFGISEYFTIRDKSKDKSLMFLHPSRGDVFTAGSTTDIEWESSGNIFLYLKMEFSNDGGNTWWVIREKIDVINTPFHWRLPSDLLSDNCLIRLSQTEDDFPINVVSAPFSIHKKPYNTLFVNTTAQAGIDLTGGYRCASWADLDRDGWEDLFVTAVDGIPNVLYFNNGNRRFSKATLQSEISNVQGFDRAGVFGDVNADGWLDLYLGGGDRFLDRLFLNNGNNHFSDITASAGIQDTFTETNGTAFLDYDLDGDLDIFVCRWGTPNALYRNTGNGTFTDVANEAGVAGPPEANTSAVAVGDYDNDGDPDLYVINSSQGTNLLYRNNGNGTFSDVTETARVGLGQNNKSALWGDFNGDRRLDLFVVRRSTENVLFLQNPDGTFSNSGRQGGVAHSGEGFITTLADFDCDGYLDILVFDRGSSNTGSAILYLNNGDGTFQNSSDISGFLPVSEPRGIGVCDYDHDGDMDVFVTDEEGPSRLYENRTINLNGNHWIQFKLRGGSKNWEAVGAKILLIAGGKKQVREIQVGTGYGDRNSTKLHFGLGTRQTAEEVYVFWPSGTISSYANLQADSTYTILEPQQNSQRSITLSSPEAGAVYRSKMSVPIKWQTVGLIDSVEIYFSNNRGAGWNKIGKIRNVGFYNWLVPDQLASEAACIRIQDVKAGQPADTSGLFIVESVPIPLCWESQDTEVSAGNTVTLSYMLADSSHRIHFLKTATCLFRFSHPQYVRAVSGSMQTGDIWGTSPNIVFQSDSTHGEIFFEISHNGEGFTGFGKVAEIQIKIAQNAPPGLTLVLRQERIQCKDMNGDTIPVVTSPYSFSLTSGISVWPGDTNNDGKVNQEDVLPLGIYFGAKGSSRTGALSAWQEQKVSSWSNPNAVYADANGDGTINENDLDVVKQNWGKIRGSFHPTLPTGEMPTSTVLRIQPIPPVNEVNFRSEIRLSNAGGFFGTALVLHYYSDKLMLDSIGINSSWKDRFVLAYQNDPGSGVLRIGLCRKTGGQNETSPDVLLSLWMRLKSDIPNNTPIVFRLDSVLVVNQDGKRLLVSTENGGFVAGIQDAGNGTPLEFRLYSNYPNPFNPSTTISYDLSENAEVVVRIYDATGKSVRMLVNEKQTSGHYNTCWSGKDDYGHSLSSGIYFYKITAGSFSAVRKCMFIK